MSLIFAGLPLSGFLQIFLKKWPQWGLHRSLQFPWPVCHLPVCFTWVLTIARSLPTYRPATPSWLPSTLKMKLTRFSEMLITAYNTTASQIISLHSISSPPWELQISKVLFPIVKCSWETTQNPPYCYPVQNFVKGVSRPYDDTSVQLNHRVKNDEN